MITPAAAAWAIVMWTGVCLPSSQPDAGCVGQLVSGLVWGTPEQCEQELRDNPMPGAECRELVGVVGDEELPDAPPGLDEVLRDMEANAEARRL